MNTTENNKLIAEFMGCIRTEIDHTEYNEDGTIKFTPNEDGSKWFIEEWTKPYFFDAIFLKKYGWCSYISDNSMLYHSDWNWLMQVVEKIESLDGNIHICNNDIFVHFPKRCRELIRVDGERLKINRIEAVYNACLEFIKWYNQQS